jgi:hypothetical protein
MKWLWWNASRGDVIGVLFVMLVLGLLVFVAIRPSAPQNTNAGFGPDWDCTPQGQGGPTCIKKPGR